INHMWANPGNVNHIDANARGNWQRIYLTVTLTGQTVEVVLVNDSYVPQIFGLNAFNNGNDNVAGIAGTIRIWTQINNVNALVPYEGLTVTATLDDGTTCAMEFVRINRPWNNQDYVNMIDVRKTNADWDFINFTVELNGQAVELRLVNNLFTP
ncbi:MAG: hypothetical protein FWC93_08430, partial [Defluviitaleaceae bacterium]|nr:hypothetical protein [Defluviitaleaceae bacterium]